MVVRLPMRSDRFAAVLSCQSDVRSMDGVRAIGVTNKSLKGVPFVKRGNKVPRLTVIQLEVMPKE